MVSVKVLNMGKVSSMLKGKSKKVIALADSAINESGLFMESEVVASIAGQRGEPVSVDTGRFKNSVTTDNSQKLQSKISTNVSYGPGLEYGTSKMNARHHFGNSAQRNKKKVTGFIQDKVNQI